MFSARAIELLEADKMTTLVAVYAPLIRAKELGAVATYFAGWFSGVALGLQYSMSMWNRSISLSLEQLTIQLCQGEHGSEFWFVLDDCIEQEAPCTDEERAEWRKQTYRQFYSQTVAPLFQSLADATGIGVGMIWGQMPTRFHYYLDVFTQAAQEPAAIKRIADDFRCLSREVEPAVFGRDKNPFDVKVRWIDDPRVPDKKLRMKNACCLYYQTEGGEYCYTCPRMNERERAERQKRMMQKTSEA